MAKSKSPAAQRAARARRHKFMLGEMIYLARRRAFNGWLALVAEENPNGSTLAAKRRFEEAWRQSI